MAYQVPDEVHLDLVNWARYCWLGDWPGPTNAGPGWLGGRPPPRDDDDGIDAPDDGPVPVYHPRARLVQQAWERLPADARLVLRAEYPARSGNGRRWEAGRLNMQAHRFDSLLEHAVTHVERFLEAYDVAVLR